MTLRYRGQTQPPQTAVSSTHTHLPDPPKTSTTTLDNTVPSQPPRRPKNYPLPRSFVSKANDCVFKYLELLALHENEPYGRCQRLITVLREDCEIAQREKEIKSVPVSERTDKMHAYLMELRCQRQDLGWEIDELVDDINGINLRPEDINWAWKHGYQ